MIPGPPAPPEQTLPDLSLWQPPEDRSLSAFMAQPRPFAQRHPFIWHVGRLLCGLVVMAGALMCGLALMQLLLMWYVS